MSSAYKKIGNVTELASKMNLIEKELNGAQNRTLGNTTRQGFFVSENKVNFIGFSTEVEDKLTQTNHNHNQYRDFNIKKHI